MVSSGLSDIVTVAADGKGETFMQLSSLGCCNCNSTRLICCKCTHSCTHNYTCTCAHVHVYGTHTRTHVHTCSHILKLFLYSGNVIGLSITTPVLDGNSHGSIDCSTLHVSACACTCTCTHVVGTYTCIYALYDCSCLSIFIKSIPPPPTE